MGEVPNVTWVTGEMSCSPGLAGENISLTVVDRSPYYEALIFLYLISFLHPSPPFFFSFYFGLHQNRDDFLLLLSSLEREVDCSSAFVEFGLPMLKIEFGSFNTLHLLPLFSLSGTGTRSIVITIWHSSVLFSYFTTLFMLQQEERGWRYKIQSHSSSS